MNIYLKLVIYLIPIILFFTFIDVSFPELFYKYVLKKKRRIYYFKTDKIKENNSKTSSIIYNYYQLFNYCTIILYDDVFIDYFKHNINVFVLYMSIIFFIYFVIIFILKYKIIESTKKYNYLYLINAFICCIMFYLYYGSYFYKKIPKLEHLFDKYLTPKEKEMYKKIWGSL